MRVSESASPPGPRDRRAADRRQESLFKQLSDAEALAHVGSWEWDIATDTLRWSDELYRIYGLPLDQPAPTYDGFLARVHADDRERVSAVVQQARRDGRPFAFEHRIVRRDGVIRTVYGRGEVDLGPDNIALRMIGIEQDVTDRSQAESEREAFALERSARAGHDRERFQFHGLFDTSPAGIAVMAGPDHVFEIANAAYRLIVRDRPLIGLSVRDAFPELEGQGISEMIDGVYLTGETVHVPQAKVMLDRDRAGKLEATYFDLTFQALRDPDGTISGVMVHAIEVTDAVLAQEQRRGIIDAISHDLKQPLTTISGNVGLLRRRALLRGVSVPDIERMAEVVEHAAKRMGAMIDDLVVTSSAQSGEIITLDRQPADLVALVTRVLNEWQRAEDAERFRLDTPVEALIGDIDVTAIERVISNLLSNAVKYSGEGSAVVVSIETSGDPEGRWVTIRVADHGSGIPAAELERVFDPYYRASNAISTGSGIGLTGARIAVEQHGGTLAAESIEGRGSTFTVRLPQLESARP